METSNLILLLSAIAVWAIDLFGTLSEASAEDNYSPAEPGLPNGYIVPIWRKILLPLILMGIIVNFYIQV